jgi:hypothetical protein
MIRISLNILLSEFVFHYYTIDFGWFHPFFYGGGRFGWQAVAMSASINPFCPSPLRFL